MSTIPGKQFDLATLRAGPGSARVGCIAQMGHSTRYTLQVSRYNQACFVWPIPVWSPGLFMGHDPTRGSGQELVGISRIESGRVGSGQEVFNLSWVGTGRITLIRPDPIRPEPRSST